MALYFGKTVVSNFGRVFQEHPRLLTKNTFLNFLRHYKSLHPRYTLPKLLQNGVDVWKLMRDKDKSKFSQKEILKKYPFNRKVRNAGWRYRRLLPLKRRKKRPLMGVRKRKIVSNNKRRKRKCPQSRE